MKIYNKKVIKKCKTVARNESEFYLENPDFLFGSDGSYAHCFTSALEFVKHRYTFIKI